MIDEITFNITDVEGRKGGGKSGGDDYTVRTPVEAPNSLASNSIATVVDLISEGEIDGLVGGLTGIYFDEVALYDGGYNFEGVSVSDVNGYPYASQGYLQGITDETPTESVIAGDQEVSHSSTPSPQTIDANTDDIRISLYVQTFQQTDTTNGDILPTSAQVRIDIQADGGSWQAAKYVTFSGRRSGGQYLRSIRIRKLSDYGAGPWLVRVVRITADSTSSYLINNTYWYSYTRIIARKLNYPNKALVGFTASAKQFGSIIPNRAFHTKGILCTIPTGYDPVYATYTDPWDGTMTNPAYTNNPAWIMYEIITNMRWGTKQTLSAAAKAELYNISKYCDELVDDGAGGTERRYTFNYQFTQQVQAVELLRDVASSCHTMIYYDGISWRFAQDKPTPVSKIVNNSNVIDGLFNRSSSSLESRHNVARVTWFDMDDFCRRRVEVVEDIDGITRYGKIKTTDVTDIGCTSRGQAYRYGKWLLDTELNQTNIITYQASWDHLSVTPGDVISIMDHHYAGVQAQEGRLVSATTSGVTIDSTLTMESGHTYTIEFTTTSGSVVTGESLVTNVGDQTELEFTTPIDPSLVPQAESVYNITDVNELEAQEWRVISVKEIEKNIFEVLAVEHDSNKYSRIEDGFQYAEAPYTNLPAGIITAPTNLSAEEFTYTEGGLDNHKFGVLLTWNHSTDSRRLYYELQYQNVLTSSGAYTVLDPQITEDSWVHKPVVSGTYNYRVRAVAVTGRSAWETLTDFDVIADPAPIPAITGMTVISGSDSDTFIGKDCQIQWDEPVSSGTLKEYKLEVYTIDDILLRTEKLPKNDTRYTYYYGLNEQDNGGTAARTFKFKVYGINYYDKVGAAGTLVVNNPAPDMSSVTPNITALPTGLLIDWSPTADNDLSHYKIYYDTFSPPTTEIGQVSAGTEIFQIPNLTPEISYYVQIEPYDVFGVGTKSQISSDAPTKMPWESIESELANRLELSDSKSTTSSGLRVLLDYDLTTSGIDYVNTDWVQYEFPVESLQNAIWLVASGSLNCYISYKDAADTSWNYLKAEADHTTDSSGRLLAASNESDAQTNYWTADAGDGNKNVALFPNGLVAKYLRLHILNTTRLRELHFVDEVIAELIVADTLSAITADLGTVTAGAIQSSNWGAADGYQHDLTNDIMKWGGNSDPKMSWDGSKVELHLDDDGKITVGSSDETIISGAKVTVGTGDDVAILDGANTTYRVWAGDATPANAPFSVEKDGTVYMSSGQAVGDFAVGGKVLNSSLIKCLWWEIAETVTPSTGWGSNYDDTYDMAITVSGFFPAISANYIIIDAGALASSPEWNGSKGSYYGWSNDFYGETRWYTKLEFDSSKILEMAESFETYVDNDPSTAGYQFHMSTLAGGCDNTTDACQDATGHFYSIAALGGNFNFGQGALNRSGNGTGSQWGGVIVTDGVNRDVDISYKYSWVRNGYNGSETATIRIYGWATFLRVDEQHFPSTGWANDSPATGNYYARAYVD